MLLPVNMSPYIIHSSARNRNVCLAKLAVHVGRTFLTWSHTVTVGNESALHLHERLRFTRDAAGPKLVELHEAVAPVSSEASSHRHPPSSLSLLL